MPKQFQKPFLKVVSEEEDLRPLERSGSCHKLPSDHADSYLPGSVFHSDYMLLLVPFCNFLKIS